MQDRLSSEHEGHHVPPTGPGGRSVMRAAFHRIGDGLGAIGLRHPRTQVPAMVFLLAMAILSIERAVLLWGLPDFFEQTTRAERWRAFIVGLRFDAVIACMAAAPLLALIIPAPPVVMRHRWYRRAVGTVCGGIAGLMLLIAAADYLFFKEFGQRLNYQVIEYTQYDYVWRIMWEQFPVIGMLAVVLVGGGGFGWAIARFAFNQNFDVAPIWQTLLWPAVSVALVVLGIRGSVGPKPINVGPAYFSSSPAVVQLSLNGAFTLREALVTHWRRTLPLDLYHDLRPIDQSIAATRRLIGEPGARWVDDVDHPLQRVVPTDRPRRDYNVVLIVLESMSWHYIGAMGGEAGLTPNIDRLADEGILFDRCFAVGSRTTRGMVGLVAGFPDLFGESISTRETALGRVTTLANLLGQRGYETMFIYAGQPHYDHRRAFLGSNGYDRFVFEGDFASKTFRTHLGWCDGDLYRSADAVFDRMDEDQPFFATLLTLSFHRDYSIPDGVIDPVSPDSRFAEQKNAIRYTDHALGRFIEQARQSEYFDRTIFVITADHEGGYALGARKQIDYRVPFLIYAPSILGGEGRKVSTLCSQTDVAPTILALLGGEYEHGFFGSDVLGRPIDRGVAVGITRNETLMLYEPDGAVAVVPPNDIEPRLYRLDLPDRLRAADPPTDAEHRRTLRMKRDVISIIQTAEHAFTNAPPSQHESAKR